MRNILYLAGALALAACATTGLTAKQTLYAAQSAYNTALIGAVTYAESPSASPAVKKALANANDRVRPAVEYAHAYVLCKGSNATVTAALTCKLFDFRPTTVQGYAQALRAGTLALYAAQGGK